MNNDSNTLVRGLGFAAAASIVVGNIIGREVFLKTRAMKNFRRKMMKTISIRGAVVAIVIGVFFALNCFAQAGISNRKIAARADEYLKNLVRFDRFGDAVLIARGGKIIFSKGYGMANLEYDAPNTPKTKFRIGSITKQFTTAAILILEERGKLSVRDAVCKYVPDCPAAWQPITIHNLLAHTSGIPSFTEFPDNDDCERRRMSPLDTIAKFKNKPLDFEPGAKHYYSDSNYLVLGYIVEKTSGKSYEDFLRENIFEPLAMKDTGYDRPRAVLKNRATGYAKENDSVKNASYYFEMQTPFAAGGLYSTVEDLYVWSQALDGEKILTKKSLEAMQSPQSPESYLYWYGTYFYGYGWKISRLFNRRLTWHDGGIGGFVSYIGRYPNERVTVVILSNREDSYVRRASRDLAAIVFGEKYALPTAAVKISPQTLDAYVGQYRYDNGAITTFAREGENLIRLAPNGDKLVLIPQSDTEFSSSGGYSIKFVRDASGRVTHLVAFEDKEAKKIK